MLTIHDPRDREPDEAEIAARKDEQIREQRWAEFVALIHRHENYQYWCWHDMVVNVASAMSRPGANTETIQAMRSFAETEGWDGVLAALSRAMKEQQAEAAEIERRR